MPESFHPENMSRQCTSDLSSDAQDIAPESVYSSVSSPSRRAALSLSAAACGAALLWRGRPAHAALPHSDTQILRFLEELEELQADFFRRSTVSSAGAGLSSRDREILSTIARQDREHFSWLNQARGKYRLANEFYLPNTSQSRPPRSFAFAASDFARRGQILEMATRIKETAVGAYQGFVLKVEEPRLAQSIAALAGVEGRHAAALQTIGSTDIRPPATEIPLSTSQVMGRLREFGFRGEALQ